MKSKISFYGGVGSVTGANFLLETEDIRILVDCGLEQGSEFAPEINAAPFEYNPSDIDVLLVTHAHADHIGRIPKLVAEGFRGDIYSTTPTKELSGVMLEDAFKVMSYEYERFGRQLLYERGDIAAALKLWKTKDYHSPFQISDISINFSNAGHILGSAIVTLVRNNKKFVFTGDIGNVPQPLLNPPDIPKQYDYMVMESVYGDRLHEQVEERTALLAQVIQSTVEKRGTLIIPAFSLERTQAMLFEINNLVEKKIILPLPVFLDSPLAIAVTQLYRQYPEYLKNTVQEQIANGDDIFDFSGLTFTHTVKDSHEIDEVKGPKIIIAGSGMSHGGRIRRHEQVYLGDPRTTVLLVGYQSVGSLGRLLHDGATKVTIDGKEVKVKAKIEKISGYSGHADRDQLLSFVAGGCEQVTRLFVTMGEERSSLFLVQRLHDYLGIQAIAPEANQSFDIDF
jgi:metallo-beta-lactamase family protein